MSGDYQNYYILEIDQNTEKSPEDLRWLAVIQTPVKKPSTETDLNNSHGVNNTATTATTTIIITGAKLVGEKLPSLWRPETEIQSPGSNPD